MRKTLVPTLMVLFFLAGCGKSDDGVSSSASLAAQSVNCFATINKISTQGASWLSCNVRIVTQGDTEWCSFQIDEQQSTIDAIVGEPIYLYLEQNFTDQDRTAVIEVNFSDGYATTLSFTQTKYLASADYDRAWGEQPAMRPGDTYIYKTYHTTLSGGIPARNYSICYDREKHVSHWVAYPIHKVYTTPSLNRIDRWAYDPNTQLPTIPEQDQQYILRGYGVSGYDRGHMLPNASRYNTRATNEMTFYATNMMPQNSTLNQNIWASLEGKVRAWGGTQRYDTLFVVTGTFFGDSKTINNANGPIAVPTHCWKVMLRQRGNQNRQISELAEEEVKAIGFIFVNSSAGAATSLRGAACTVKEIEDKTGFQFFRTLDPAAADAVKSQLNYNDWSGL